MPNTRAQHVVFSILMSFAMVYGMELYNQALMAGGLSTELFLTPFEDIVPLMVVVIVLETLIGGKIAHHCTFKYLRAGQDPALLITVFLGAFACWTMCPMMSCVATIAFKQPPLTQFVATWLQTTACNFPMALLWQLFVAGPAVRFVARQLYKLPFLAGTKNERERRGERRG